jgi:hypothetical protein
MNAGWPKIGVVVLLLVWFGLPFVLQQDLWPMFRMGMFSQSAKGPMADENWVILHGSLELDPTTIGFSRGGMQALCRKAYYTHRAQLLLQDLAMADPNKGKPAQWQLLRIQGDSTLVVAKYRVSQAISRPADHD